MDIKITSKSNQQTHHHYLLNNNQHQQSILNTRKEEGESTNFQDHSKNHIPHYTTGSHPSSSLTPTNHQYHQTNNNHNKSSLSTFQPSMPLNLPSPAPTRCYFSSQMSRTMSSIHEDLIVNNDKKQSETSSSNSHLHHLLPSSSFRSTQEANLLLYSLLSGQIDHSSKQISDHFEHDLEKKIVDLNWDQIVLDFIKNSNYRSAIKCLSNHQQQALNKNCQKKSNPNAYSFSSQPHILVTPKNEIIKLSKSHLIYNFYLSLKYLSLPLNHCTLSSLTWYLSYHENWFEVLHVLSELPQEHWDFDIYKLAVRAHLRKRPKDIKSAELILTRASQSNNVTDAQKTQLKLFFESNVRAESWEDCKRQYEMAKSKALSASSSAGMTTLDSTNSGHNSYDNSPCTTPTMPSFSPKLSFSSPFQQNQPLQSSPTQSHQSIFIPSSTQIKLLELGNAAIDICITYDEFEYGWNVYEGLPIIDKHTLRVAMNLCKSAIRKLIFIDSHHDMLMENMKWEGRAWTLYMRAKESGIPDAISFVVPQMIDILTHGTQVTSPGTKVLRLYQEFVEYRSKNVVNRSSMKMATMEEKFLRGLAQIYISGHYNDIVLAACWQIYEAIKSRMTLPDSYVLMLQVAARMETMETFKVLCEEINTLRSDASSILEKAKEIIASMPVEDEPLVSQKQEKFVAGSPSSSSHHSLPDYPHRTSSSSVSEHIGHSSPRSSMDVYSMSESERLNRKISSQSTFSSQVSDLSLDSLDISGDQAIGLIENDDLVHFTQEEAFLVLGSWVMRILEL